MKERLATHQKIFQLAFLIAAVLVSGNLTSEIRAATFTVNSTADSGDGTCDGANCTLREAITAANANVGDDAIAFDANIFGVSQTINLTAGELVINDNDSLTINGTGAALLRISGNGQTRVLNINGGTVVIRNLSISNGRANFAAGIFVQTNSSVTLERVTVENNSAIGASGANGQAAAAGGIQVDGTLNLNDSIVRNNSAQGGKGADGASAGGSLTGIPGGNGANASGGGIYIKGTLNLKNSIIRLNTALGGNGGNGGNGESILGNGAKGGAGGHAGSSFGGGIYVDSSAQLSVTSSSISENKSQAGIAGKGGSGLGSGTFQTGGNGGNAAPASGGGIYASSSAVVKITGSLLWKNSAQTFDGGNGGGGGNGGTPGTGGAGANGSGGAIANGGTLFVANSTIDENSAAGSKPGMAFINTSGQSLGGGVYQTGNSSFINVTITNNSVMGGFVGAAPMQARGGGFFGSGSFGNTIIANNTVTQNTTSETDFSGTFNSLGYNLIGNTTGATISGTTTGNKTGIDPLLGPLQDNGGFTFTRAPLSGSPVINAGNNLLAVDTNGNPLRFDQRGSCFRRIVDGTVEIGAFETQDVTAGSTSCTNPFFDFDGDGRSDVSVFRPSDGVWYLLQSAYGFTSVKFGISTDKLVPADYDGDGRTDIAVWRDNNPNVEQRAYFYILQSSNGEFRPYQFGRDGDVPVSGDFDGDGKADLAVYRNGANGGQSFFYYRPSTQPETTFISVPFGSSGDQPVVADYDGDGKSDFAVYRPSNGTWYMLRSQAGFTGAQFGISSDKPVVGDYDGDGKADQAVYRDGVWYILGSTRGFYGVQFGIATDLPTPADYDGDGKSDIAVYREGVWFIQRSNLGFTVFNFGTANDLPTANAFIRR